MEGGCRRERTRAVGVAGLGHGDRQEETQSGDGINGFGFCQRSTVRMTGHGRQMSLVKDPPVTVIEVRDWEFRGDGVRE